MPILQLPPGSPRDVKFRLPPARGLRRAAVVAGAVGLTAGAGLLSAGSALASNGSQPGDLILHPASGVTSLKPTWSTTDPCPTGYQASAEVSEFKANGTFGSRISTVVNADLTHPFSGVLDGDVAALLALGAHVGKGQTSEWAIGCYSGIGGTGKVKWVQSTFVTLSADGKSYTTSSSNGSADSSSGQSITATGQSQGATAPASSGTNTQLEVTLIAGGCGLLVATTGVYWQRRRNRSRLQ
jgi:hypothetical protein